MQLSTNRTPSTQKLLMILLPLILAVAYIGYRVFRSRIEPQPSAVPGLQMTTLEEELNLELTHKSNRAKDAAETKFLPTHELSSERKKVAATEPSIVTDDLTPRTERDSKSATSASPASKPIDPEQAKAVAQRLLALRTLIDKYLKSAQAKPAPKPKKLKYVTEIYISRFQPGDKDSQGRTGRIRHWTGQQLYPNGFVREFTQPHHGNPLTLAFDFPAGLNSENCEVHVAYNFGMGPANYKVFADRVQLYEPDNNIRFQVTVIFITFTFLQYE